MLFELSESPKQSYSDLPFNPLIWENLEIKGAIWSKEVFGRVSAFLSGWTR